MEVRTSFNQIIILDDGTQIEINAGEGDFLKFTLSNGGSSVTAALDSIVGSKVIRMMQLSYSNQVEAKRII